MRRTLFEPEHEEFRQLVRKVIEREVTPYYEQWREAGIVPRDLFRTLGAVGVMGFAVPGEYGGGGSADYRFNVVIQEETARSVVTLGGLRTHLDIVLPYFLAFADDDQRGRWFPGLASGDLYTAIAMSEPGVGSDLAGISTTAVRDGNHYVVNGAKTFITGGGLADLFVVVVRTGRDPDDRRAGLSLLVIEKDTPGFTVGRRLEKIGLSTQDTVELAFEDVRVPVANRLGPEGSGFTALTHNLAQERLAIAVGAVAQAFTAHEHTIRYVRERTVFGRCLAQFQNTKFELAAMAAELAAGQALLDAAVRAHLDGELTPADAAKTKLFCTEMQGRVVDRCLQLHGGYGYVTEYPIARMYADARVTRIYGGTSEVLKTIISKSLEL